MYTIKVEGLRELIVRADAADKATKKMVREGLRDAVEPVRDDASRRLREYDEKSASNYRVIVRRTGMVAVEQRLRRTTGLRPDFAKLQKRKALYPAAEAKRPEVLRRMEALLEKVASVFVGRL